MRLITIAVLCVLCSPLFAQIPSAAKEMGEFDKVLGNWTGSGTVEMSPSQSTMNWTSSMTLKKILDGHYVQEDMVIQLPQMPDLIYRTIYTWDTETKTFLAFNIGNVGDGVQVGPVYWVGNQLISSKITSTPIGTTAMQQVSTYNEDTFTYVNSQSDSGKDFGEIIRGSYKRSEKGYSADQSAKMALAPAEEMKKFSANQGWFKMKGSVSPMAGMPSLDFTATQRVHSLLGGHLQITEIQGDPMEGTPFAYRGMTLLGWSKIKNQYIAVSLSNMGGFPISHVTQEGREQVWASKGSFSGTPLLVRTTAKFEKDGSVLLETFRMAGSNAPYVSFKATLTPIKAPVEKTAF